MADQPDRTAHFVEVVFYSRSKVDPPCALSMSSCGTLTLPFECCESRPSSLSLSSRCWRSALE